MTELVAVTSEQNDEINKAESYLNGAKNFIINDDRSYNSAGEMLKQIKAKKKSLDDMRKSLKKPINEAGKRIEDMFREPLNFLLQAEQSYKKSMIKYKETMEYIDCLQQKQKQDRLEILELAKIDAIKTNNEIEFYRITNEINELQNNNQLTPKVDGISYRDNWKGEGFDLIATIKAISEGKAPISIVRFDDIAINQLAKSTKGTIDYPGIKFYNDQIIATRGDHAKGRSD